MDVLFAVLPFADCTAPAIGVSTLKAQLTRSGFTSHVRYFSFDLAEAIGLDLYEVLTSPNPHDAIAKAPPTDSLIGEWFFAQAAFGAGAPDDHEYRSTFLLGDARLRPYVARIMDARERLEPILDAWTEEIRALRPKVVGFTTVFHQTCACLALAIRLKQLPDPPVLVFGGANCAGPMGVQLIRSFSCIDYVCVGEGDEVFPAFLARLLNGGDTRSMAGMVGREAMDTPTRAPLVTDMDALPTPDYTEYYERQRVSPLGDPAQHRLLIETSRGCWWGEKHHCTFCGLNAETMTFRAKSADRVLSELQELTEKYDVTKIDCVDNIMYMKYLQTLFPRVAEQGLELDLFYEVKSNLRYDQLQILRNAGIKRIQAGIESFSDDVLRLMRKGCTGLQNIQLLRWCAELGIDVIWNLIYGFPNESPGEYRRMAKLIPQLTHLRTPSYLVQIRLDRFSPNFMEPEGFDLTDVLPSPAYSQIFPLADDELAQIAYFFQFAYKDGRDPEAYTRALAREIAKWEKADRLPRDERPRLDMFDAGSVALIEDTRPDATDPLHVLRGLERDVYVACDVARSADYLATSFGVGEREVARVLAPLVRARVMAESGGKYLSLALFQTRDIDVVSESPARDRKGAASLRPRSAPTYA